jgi:hypothetical protein
MRSTGPDKKTRDIVYGRDLMRCQLQGCTDGPFEIQHRRARGMGGSRAEDINSPANLVLLCATCHRHIEAHPVGAESAGFRVRQGKDPAEQPITTWTYGWCYLLADGSVDHIIDGAA